MLQKTQVRCTKEMINPVHSAFSILFGCAGEWSRWGGGRHQWATCLAFMFIWRQATVAALSLRSK